MRITKSQTEHEIDFIDKLGTHSNHAADFNLSRVELLRGYIDGAKRRVDWGDIDRETILVYALKLLKSLERRS